MTRAAIVATGLLALSLLRPTAAINGTVSPMPPAEPPVSNITPTPDVRPVKPVTPRVWIPVIAKEVGG